MIIEIVSTETFLTHNFNLKNESNNFNNKCHSKGDRTGEPNILVELSIE